MGGELAARGAVFYVPPDAFLIHFNTYDVDETGRKPKKKYGHFPNDWMLGALQFLSFPPRVTKSFPVTKNPFNGSKKCQKKTV